MGRACILLVDDDDALRTAVGRAFELEGYDVREAEDGLVALTAFNRGIPPDLVVLDVLMPNLDGLSVCRTLRSTSEAPILMLTARDAVEDRVDGLEAGADDYLVKPFDLKELIARVRALLRRSHGAADILRYDDLELDRAERRAQRGDHVLALTRIEFALLEVFLSRPRKVLTRSRIFESVWGYDMAYASNSLEVHIGYLRRKLEAHAEPRLIHTVRGVGYVLRSERP